MEGIPVKISEKYKPPRKITIPASVQNKLSTVINFEKYDFGLEYFVLEQMAKLREQQKLIDNKEVDVSNLKEIESIPLSSNPVENVLTPVPLKPLTDNGSKSQKAVDGINISDFENDTSSPFDSVELKTINDMEELAHVLGGTTVDTCGKWSNNENGCNTQNWAWGNHLNPAYLNHSSHNLSKIVEKESTTKNNETENNEISTIMKSLQKRIEERSVAFEMKKISNSGISIAAGGVDSESMLEKKRDTLPNPFSSLSGSSQVVAERIAEMGFPLSRAARATEIFGPNEGKVIEFMLEVQSLEESGYLGESAERALVACEFSRDAAVKFLDNLAQIMRLGFTEDEVVSALIKSEFDRDKALDSLIS